MSLNMRAARNILVLIAILALSATASATEHQAGTWVSFATSGKFGDSDSRWRYCFDVQARYVDIGSGANQYVGRPALGYALNDSVTARLGYARVETRSQSGLSAHENRYWQQIDWTAARWGSAKLSMRLRLEQRSLSIGDDVGLSLRYRVRLSQPLGESSRYRLVLSLEPFLDLRDTDWRGPSGLNQNRFFAGVNTAFGNRWGFEAGYMNQYIGFDSSEDASNQLFVARFILNPR